MKKNNYYDNIVFLDNNSIGVKYSSSNFVIGGILTFFVICSGVSEVSPSIILPIALVYLISFIIMYQIRKHKMENLYAFILTNDCLIINKLRIFSINTKTIPLVDIFSVNILTGDSQYIKMTYLKNNKQKKMTINNVGAITDEDLVRLINQKKYTSH